jgi:hypothetical protein
MAMEHEDAWHVQLESGEVRILTLDQLDRFYQNSIIDEDTYVLQDGEMQWRKLGEVIGGDAEEEAPPPPKPQVVLVAPTPTPSPALVAYTPPPVYQPQSIRPVVSEIDADELSFDDAMFKKSNKVKYVAVGAILTALAAMGAVVGASRMGHSVSAAEVNAAMIEATPTTPPPPVATTPPPPPVDPQPAVQAPKLTDDAKKALSDKDTQLNQKMQQRRQSRTRNAPAPAHRSSAPFSKNGSAYDPLNAKL